MKENNRKPIASIRKLPQFTIMNVIDGQAVQIKNISLIFYSLTINNILNIIVLLILAGISISMLTGQNGILNKATEAKIETIIGHEKDQIALAYNSALVNNLGSTVTTKDLQQELDELVGANKATVTSGTAGILKVLFLETTNNYKVNNGKISIITGDEPEVEPTSIYAELYSYTDGSGDVLILSSYDYQETATDLTLKADYGDISGDEYYWDWDIGEGNLPPWVDLDWENGINKNNIIEAKIIDTIVPKTTACYFSYCRNIQDLNLENLNTSQVTDMSGMFYYCESLTTLDLSGFNTCKVTDMSCMFGSCFELTEIPKGLLDDSQNVTDFSYMFEFCESLTGEAPELWKRVKEDPIDYIGVPGGFGCFGGCENLTNFEDIPEYWKSSRK